jgi:hypothetical protein
VDDQGFEVVRGRHVRAPPAKYVSKFKRTSEKVEDTILNTILLGKLNKFSPSNYDDIKEFITQIIASGQSDMMTCFMKLVFEKAAAEEIFCPLYAKLLSELSAQYPVILPEMAKLYEAYMSIFVDVAPAAADESHQAFCQRNVEKKYRRGYSQFLAELTKHNVIETAVFVETVRKIVEQIELSQGDAEAVKRVEELADCLVRMMKALGCTVGSAVTDMALIRSTLRGEAVRIQPLTVRRADAPGVPPFPNPFPNPSPPSLPGAQNRQGGACFFSESRAQRQEAGASIELPPLSRPAEPAKPSITTADR